MYASRKHQAVYGQGLGRQGSSFAIPTKGYRLETLPLYRISNYVKMFLEYAECNPNLSFNVTAIGCGLAGYTPEDIAPMFKNHPDNVNLPEEFKKVLNEELL